MCVNETTMRFILNPEPADGDKKFRETDVQQWQLYVKILLIKTCSRVKGKLQEYCCWGC